MAEQLWGVAFSGVLVHGVVAESDIEAMALAAKKVMGGSSAGKLGKMLQTGYRAVKVTVEVQK